MMVKKSIALFILILAIFTSFSALLPNTSSGIETPEHKFSSARALVHLKAISKKPHFSGNKAHAKVRDYIIRELNALGLATQIQKGFTISKWRNIAKPINIIAKIKGRNTGKALMLLTHYDSNPHSSLGASDAGSGVVTILEALRAFLSKNKSPKNDIIILFSDAEELGLNGADLFVNHNDLAKEVGLVLNFEARGSGGPSYMLIETNGGNATLMHEFVRANPKFPVANSLAYSIYKKLPNDTDLTVFRRDGDIDGFNFAFIDDHFDYHTQMDTFERLDRNTLEHQGSYMMPLLYHFSEINLNALKSDQDYIYFNVPFFKIIMYPYSWILPMLIIGIILFIALLVYGFKNKRLNTKIVLKGFFVFLSALLFSGLLSYIGWQFILILYPKYNDILQGFTYNGHTYIWLFVFLTIGICFYSYHKVYAKNNTPSLLVAPLSIWVILCSIIALELKGASFFIIPVFFALLAFFVLLRQKQPSLVIMALISIPLLFIISPLVKMFPVGLGLKMLYVSAIFVVLIFGLLLPVLGYFKHKKRWAYLFFLFGFTAFLKAHFNSSFTIERPKPNSLVYTLNTDTNEAFWATYDVVLDPWSKDRLGENPPEANALNSSVFGSKYKTEFTYMQKAQTKAIPAPVVETTFDTIIGNTRHFNICISSLRDVQRMELFSDSTNVFNAFKVNGVAAFKEKGSDYVFEKRWKNRLFSYFVSNNEPLDLFISVPKTQKTTLELYESSFDLLENEHFSIPKRQGTMMPKPFVLNDAIVLKKTIILE